MTVSEKISRLRDINIGKLFDDILRDNEDEICDLTRSQMYDEGIMNVKTNKKEKYALSTVLAKRRAPFNKTEHITLKWMGNFHESLKLIIFKDKFVISSDNKIWANYLEPQTRFTSALGLTEKSKEELKETVRDEMIRRLKNVI